MPDFTGMMVKNLVNNQVMAVNGSRGYMGRESFGQDNHRVGYYAHLDPVTGHFRVEKKKRYVVWQAEDSIWQLLHFFKASTEQIEEWKKEKEEREKQTKESERRAKEAFEQRQREEEKRQQKMFPGRFAFFIYSAGRYDIM
jgi:hypothetical protein